MISQYLPARVGLPIGFLAAAFAAWQLGFGNFLAWQTWIVLVIGIIVICRLVLTYKDRKKYSDLSSILMQREIELRKEYLPDLKQTLNEYINQVEYLANNSEEALLYKEYDSIWFQGSLKAKGIRKFVFSITALLYLYQSLWVGNLAFREIQDIDKKLNELKTKMNGLNTFVKDKMVRTNVKGYQKASHIAYSYVILNRFLKKYPDIKIFAITFYFNTIEKAKNRLRDLQNKTNTRIDELLGGAQYEL